MIRLKGCPRCKGDLIIDRNENDELEQCLQCGYEHEPKATLPQIYKIRKTRTRGTA